VLLRCKRSAGVCELGAVVSDQCSGLARWRLDDVPGEVEPDASERGDDGAVVLGGVEREVAREQLLEVIGLPDAVGEHHLRHALRQLPLRVRRHLHHHQALVQPPPPPRAAVLPRRRRHFIRRRRLLILMTMVLPRAAVVVVPPPALPAGGLHVEPPRPGGRRRGGRGGGAAGAVVRGVVARDDGPQLELRRPRRRVEAAEPRPVPRAAVHHVHADV
jgi:hypothetical protein